MTTAPKRLLLEDTWNFQIDRARIVESKVGTLRSLIVPGVLSQCDVVNENNRSYGRKVWEANLKEGSKFRDLLDRRAAWGELEHPKSGIVDLKSPISHLITKVELSEDGNLCGEITILDDLPDGRKLRVLIEHGYNPLVSSRGYGTVTRRDDGVDEVQDDYVCEGWDIVSSPSFPKAQLTPQRESLPALDRSSVKTVSELSPSTHLAENSPQPTRQIVTNMDINIIRQGVAALRSVAILEAAPPVVANSYAQLAILHRQLAEAQVASPNLAWDCTSLHRELDLIESQWADAIKQLKAEVAQLRDDKAKLVTIAESSVRTAKLYRAQLSETVQKRNKAVKIFEDSARRGRGWQDVATKRAAELEKVEHQVQVACEAVNILATRLVAAENSSNAASVEEHKQALKELAARYHTETTKLARRLVQLQYADKLDEDTKRKLAEAKKAEDVLAIKRQLAGPKKASVSEAGSKKAATEPTPVAEIRPTTEVVAFQSESISGHSLSVDQAVGMVQRMSRLAAPAVAAVQINN